MDHVTARSIDAAAHHGRSILYVAGERRSDVRDVLDNLVAHVEARPDLRASVRVHRGVGAERITFGSGGTITLLTTDRRSRRGHSADIVLVDPDARRRPSTIDLHAITANREHAEAWLLTDPPLDLLAPTRTSPHVTALPTPGG